MIISLIRSRHFARLRPQFEHIFYRQVRNPVVLDSNGLYWTESLCDLVAIGHWIAQGEVNPLSIVVVVDGENYVYGPEGDLYSLEKILEPIRLSQMPYRSYQEKT